MRVSPLSAAKPLAAPTADQLLAWLDDKQVGAVVRAIKEFSWPEDLQVAIAERPVEETRQALARKKDCCPAAVDIIFSDPSALLTYALLQAGHLDRRRQVVARRRLALSRDPSDRALATELTRLPKTYRTKLLTDPESIVRVGMGRRRDLTPGERMQVCMEESSSEVLEGFIFAQAGTLTADEFGVLIPKLMELSTDDWFVFLREAAKNPILPPSAQVEVAKGGDAVLRASVGANPTCCPEAQTILLVDPSPTVLYNLLQGGLLDPKRQGQGRARLLNFRHPSGRVLAAQLNDLSAPEQRQRLFTDVWTVQAAMATREDLSAEERHSCHRHEHPGVRRAFASRDDLTDEELLQSVLYDDTRGVVSAIAYNETVLMPLRTLAMHKLKEMPMEAPVPRDTRGLAYYNLGPVKAEVPILGFKSWLVQFGSVLRSWTRDEFWEGAVKDAACGDPLPTEVRFESPVPHGKPHECGLYASHDLDSAHGDDYVVGAVLGRGHLMVHGNSWRAQQMELIALCPRLSGEPKQVEAADALGAILNLPVMSTVEVRNYARHFGQSVLKSLAYSEIQRQAKQFNSIWEVGS